MIFDRSLALVCILWVVLVAVAAPFAIIAGYIELVKYTLVCLFFGGAVCSAAGFIRYLPSGPKAPALLILSIEKKGVDLLLGLAFLISVLFSATSPTINIVLLMTYSLFGAAGAVSSFFGLYVFIGAGRGWISRMVYKTPFHQDKSKRKSGY